MVVVAVRRRPAPTQADMLFEHNISFKTYTHYSKLCEIVANLRGTCSTLSQPQQHVTHYSLHNSTLNQHSYTYNYYQPFFPNTLSKHKPQCLVVTPVLMDLGRAKCARTRTNPAAATARCATSPWALLHLPPSLQRLALQPLQLPGHHAPMVCTVLQAKLCHSPRQQSRLACATFV